MRIKTRLVLSTAIPSVVLMLALLVTFLALRNMTATAQTLINRDTQSLSGIQELYSQGLQGGQAIRNILLNPADEKAYANYKSAVESFNGELSKTGGLLVSSSQEKAMLDIIADAWGKDNELRDAVVGLAQQGDLEKAKELLVKQETPHWRALKGKLLELKDAKWKSISAQKATFERDRQRAQLVALFLAGVGMLLAVVIVYWSIASVMGGLERAVALADRIAGGDLSMDRASTPRDEIGRLMEHMYAMGDNLRDLIGKVSNVSSSIVASSHQIHSISGQIESGAEEVEAQTGMVATAGEEMAATAGDIARNCIAATEGAGLASSAASEGAAVVQESISVMHRIADRVRETALTVENLGARSDQIGEIIGTIEDIADQTNLLALNAAIEAARAGEQGRGFAVVADEVRALAERTTKATKEIGAMIKAIQKDTGLAVSFMNQGVDEVAQGTREASRSGEALEGILKQIGSLSMQIDQIATAAEQQTATTTEISSNIHQITDVIRQTTQGTHESTVAATRLENLADELERLIGRFTLAA